MTTDDSLLRADVLICDISGIALEYVFGTERPVLFLDVPLKIHNPRFKELEKENSCLKKLVADISLDNAILKEAARGNF